MTGRGSGPIVNVSRTFGALTEPFIRQRAAATFDDLQTELWYERATGQLPHSSRQIDIPLIRPGSIGDRAFHRLPQLGPRAARPYADAERSMRPRLIHAHYATTGYLVGMITEAPLVVSAYGFDVSVMPRRWLWRRAFGDLAKRASAVLVEGPFMAGRLLDLAFKPGQVKIVRIAASLENLPFRSSRMLHDEPMKLLTCGRLVQKKGHALAIRAFAAIRPELPLASTLEIIGDGPLDRDLRTLAARLRVADGVEFIGAQPRASYLSQLVHSDLFLAPSVTAANGDAEGGAPTTILDAQAVGTIVIGSTHSDIPFLIEDGATGYLAEEGSVESLVNTIRRAIADRDAWADHAADASRQVRDLHSDQAVGKALADIYAGLI